ncbi:LOB domain-containing protein 40-like [Senna tora]|uniref:LOB domain-containing protein 40-like n=1 Tax=Senna tora TaxID=362788 RepID=A0A834SQX5_9FABA|nr:LOB domain-containing protein 40-like [Senna tora]
MRCMEGYDVRENIQKESETFQQTKMTQTPTNWQQKQVEGGSGIRIERDSLRMRLSCNGCRVLRKGCSENCTIRPCLQWITSPESQANATVFLAKFYGRAGLLNLINAAPHHLRPAVFKSLLYESCGRIVNPVYGSMGLFWTGEWARCQAAVDAVLVGSEIKADADVASSDLEGGAHASGGAACDIRHVSRGRGRFKRVIKPKARVGWVDSSVLMLKKAGQLENVSESESVLSAQTVEGSLMNRVEPVSESRVDLKLRLG